MASHGNGSGMLIPLPELVEEFDLKIRGILHVGAHLGEEAEIYDSLGIANVTWIEGNPSLILRLKLNVGRFQHRVISALVADHMGMVDFKITNNGESSSILDLGTHKETSPQVYVERHVELMAQPLGMICEGSDITGFNFLNLDLQGAELMALQGMGAFLDRVDYVYSEVNRREVYVGCAQIEELDEFLDNFTRVRTLWCEDGGRNHGWGDAFWIRNQ